MEVDVLKKYVSIHQLENSILFNNDVHSLKKSDIAKGRPHIISEFKRKSPSKGVINSFSNPQDVAKSYEKSGASAISVLTDLHFFGGAKEDVLMAQSSMNLPILRKDFIVDEYQIYETKSIGADIILLIASCLTPSQVVQFQKSQRVSIWKFYWRFMIERKLKNIVLRI